LAREAAVHLIKDRRQKKNVRQCRCPLGRRKNERTEGLRTHPVAQDALGGDCTKDRVSKRIIRQEFSGPAKEIRGGGRLAGNEGLNGRVTSRQENWRENILG